MTKISTQRVAARFLEAGVFQVPPALYEQVEAWVLDKYAGHVLAVTLDKAANLQDILKRAESSDVSAFLGPLESMTELLQGIEGKLRAMEEGEILKMTGWVPGKFGSPEPEANFGVAYFGESMTTGKRTYLLWPPGPDQVPDKLSKWIIRPQSEDRTVENVKGWLRFYLGQLDDAPAMVQQQAAEGVAEQLVEARLLAKEVAKYTGAPKARKTVTKTEVPVTWESLQGWGYLPEILERYTAAIETSPRKGLEASALLKENLHNLFRNITLQVNFDSSGKIQQSRLGTWYSAKRLMEIIITKGSTDMNGVLKFRRSIENLQSIILHEVRHMTQDLMDAVLGLKAKAGMPPPVMKTKDFDRGGFPLKKPYRGPKDRLDHDLHDVEFQTELGDAITRFLQLSRSIQPKDRHRFVREFVGVGILRPANDFFRILKAKAPDKWRKAVSELGKAVSDAGVLP